MLAGSEIPALSLLPISFGRAECAMIAAGPTHLARPRRLRAGFAGSARKRRETSLVGGTFNRERGVEFRSFPRAVRMALIPMKGLKRALPVTAQGRQGSPNGAHPMKGLKQHGDAGHQAQSARLIGGFEAPGLAFGHAEQRGGFGGRAVAGDGAGGAAAGA